MELNIGCAPLYIGVKSTWIYIIGSTMASEFLYGGVYKNKNKRTT